MYLELNLYAKLQMNCFRSKKTSRHRQHLLTLFHCNKLKIYKISLPYTVIYERPQYIL